MFIDRISTSFSYQLPFLDIIEYPFICIAGFFDSLAYAAASIKKIFGYIYLNYIVKILIRKKLRLIHKHSMVFYVLFKILIESDVDLLSLSLWRQIICWCILI